MRNGRFFVGLVAVAGVVAYLMWTGVSNSMVYYLTPAELVERIEDDPSFRQVGVKVSGRVVEGSWERKAVGRGSHSFVVADLEDQETAFSVRYSDVLPDTFNDQAEVEVEGRCDADGVFQAHTVLTKCGSRYEAAK